MDLNYRLLFLDLDGTLVGVDEIISPRTLSVLRQAREIGCTLVLSTARNRFSLQPIAAQIGRHAFAILCNGAIIENWETGETVQRITLSRTAVRVAVENSRAFGLTPLCFGADLDGGRAVYTDQTGTLPDLFLQSNTDRLVYMDDLSVELRQLPVTMSAYGSTAAAQAVASAWRREIATEVAVYDGASLRNDCWVAYCTPARTSKAHAAQTVADLLGIPRRQTLAIGDAHNDIELLQWAGMGICMGDGHEDVQACADHITAPLAEDGAARAIERFVLRTLR